MFTRKLFRSLNGDIPVTSRIGWRPYQEHLTIQGLVVRVLDPELFFINTDALVEFTVSGSLSPHLHGESRWHPFIQSLYVSERFTDEDKSLIGDILIVPVVGIRYDKHYDNQPVMFQVAAQHKISSYRWGRNRYRVTCGHIQQLFEIIQYNKDRVLHSNDVV